MYNISWLKSKTNKGYINNFNEKIYDYEKYIEYIFYYYIKSSLAFVFIPKAECEQSNRPYKTPYCPKHLL